MATKKLRVLIFIKYYLPGYKAGGPLRTIANMVDHLGDEFDFSIVTQDRDEGDLVAYPDIVPDVWVSVGKAKILYLSPQNQSVRFLYGLMKQTAHDVVYLNSFFDAGYTLRPLLARRMLSKNQRKPLIVAPRGEFSAAAFRLKSLKKRSYLWLSKLVGMYSDAYFQASSNFEAQDIVHILGVCRKRIKIAIDLPQKFFQTPVPAAATAGWTDGVRIIFLSRISPMKNLDFALRVLQQAKCNIRFDIFGPISDPSYWDQCQAVIETIPKNIVVRYCGSVLPSDVQQTFAAYDLFLFPTRGENYGHVIVEALSAGTPVLISDRTPWRNLEADDLGWDVPLESVAVYLEKIHGLAEQRANEKLQRRVKVQEQLRRRLLAPDALDANRRMFLTTKNGC